MKFLFSTSIYYLFQTKHKFLYLVIFFMSQSKEESRVLSIQKIQEISPTNLQNLRRKYFKLHIFD
jgi:hypothetical protein